MPQENWQLLDVVADSVIVMRQDGSIAFANRQAGKLLGYTADELRDLPLEMIVPERFRQRHAERLAAYLARPVVRYMGGSLDLWALRKDGGEVPVDITLNPVETDDGLRVVASMRDVSDRKKSELELRSALAEVERLRDQLALDNQSLRQDLRGACRLDQFVGRSAALQVVLEKIDKVAPTDANVLILGETGTGKELVARAIHEHSGRKDRPLIKVSCAELPPSLLESELFGHEVGAFTGATKLHIGRFELAHGGTIFLDEIAELPVELQSKLLRAIQEGVCWRLGSETATQFDVRVIAATNRNLCAAVQEGKFRLDLYYRLSVFPIEVPPLRTRREDIPLLVWHFVLQRQAKLGKPIETISQATIDRLVAYPWPGNVRELQNVIERAMILSPNSTLVVERLLDVFSTPSIVSAAKFESVDEDEVLREYLLGILNDCHWRIKGDHGAAKRLGMNPSTLRYRMKRLGISP